MTSDIAKKYEVWRKYRETYRTLMQLSDHDLRDIGVRRGDIHDIAVKHARK